MQLLVIAATNMEVDVVKSRLNLSKFQSLPELSIDFAVSGVGMLATAYELTKLLAQKKYDWVFNVGIAGTFSNGISLGEAVVVEHEVVDGSAIEAADGSISLLQNDLACPYVDTFECLKKVQKVKGLTVNLLTENPTHVLGRKTLYGADIETMEGAAFFYVSNNEKVKYMQLRGVSNVVGIRDKAQWKTQEALENVGDLLNSIVGHAI